MGAIYIGGGLCLLQGGGICFCVDQKKKPENHWDHLAIGLGYGDVMRCDQCANGDGAGGNNHVLCKKCYTGQTGLVCHANHAIYHHLPRKVVNVTNVGNQLMNLMRKRRSMPAENGG